MVSKRLATAEAIAVFVIAIVVALEFLGVETVGQVLPQEAKDSFQTLSLDLGQVDVSVNQGSLVVMAIIGGIVFLYFGLIRDMITKKSKGRR